ncbi:GNAT family N-acetyltransferase [Roseomonas sp. 18066]|uniref:GNAT family N-acetyltransferase n=1 Tax=Roseomonas sp. 18066 TaxID=2681412 RepID=UPI00135B01D7|nr:GNAT family N-acetyltransferase [Roseomonas sp. 18066]
MSDTIIHSPLQAPEAQAVLDALVEEFAAMYGTDRPGGARGEVDRYPAAAFAPPLGDFLVLLRDGVPIAGGAFMSHDDETAEIKRVWVHADHRRQGLARRIMAALEARAGALGYTRAYLTTGFRQPEAVGLYVSLGYRALFDLEADPALFRSLPFEKHIGARAGQPATSPRRRPAASLDAATIEVTATKQAQERRILARLAQHAAVV